MATNWRNLPCLLLFTVLGIFLSILGVYSQFPATITPDAAMHAEIVESIGHQGFLTTWEPYAENSYTYPPLFHYIVFVLPLEPIDAVRALGIALWLVLPIAMYFLVSTYDNGSKPDKKAGLIAALLIGLVPVFSNVFIYSEFPQLMSMILLLIEWYFLRTRKITHAGVVVGLIALTHVFFVLVASALYVYYLWLYRTLKVRYVAAPVIVALPWAFAYWNVVLSVLAGTWENTRYNVFQPVFGFWPWQTIKEWLFSAHGITLLLFALALYGWLKVRDRSDERADYALRGMFVFCLVLTVFHVPFTQLKMLDLLALPTVMLAALGLTAVSLKSSWRNLLVAAVLIFLAVGQVQHFIHVRENWFNPEIAPTEELIDAARWLKYYDNSFVRVYVHQASAWGGILSHKIPLYPDITRLETFSPSYKEQLDAQEMIKDALTNDKEIDEYLIQEYGVQYFIVPVELQPKLELLYMNGVWGVYR